MSDEQLDDYISKETKDKMEMVERQNSELLEEVRRVEGEKRYVESELFRLQKELKRMRSELERLKSPPLIIGNIKDVLVDGRVIVKSSTGPDFIVTTSEYVPADDDHRRRQGGFEQADAGRHVGPACLPGSYRHRGGDIEKPSISYDDVGGLEEQIVRSARRWKTPAPAGAVQEGRHRAAKGRAPGRTSGNRKDPAAKAVAHQTNATFITHGGFGAGPEVHRRGRPPGPGTVRAGQGQGPHPSCSSTN